MIPATFEYAEHFAGGLAMAQAQAQVDWGTFPDLILAGRLQTLQAFHMTRGRLTATGQRIMQAAREYMNAAA